MGTAAVPTSNYCMLIFINFAAGHPFASAPSELNLGKNMFHFGWLLSFQQSKAHAIKTDGAACYACPMPVTYPQILLSFASSLNPKAQAQAKVLLLHHLSLKNLGCMLNCFAVILNLSFMTILIGIASRLSRSFKTRLGDA